MTRITISERAGKGLGGWLGGKLKAAIPHLPRNGLREISIVLVGDRTMSALHQSSHGDPSPTDVLTYELEWAGKHVTEGEIVVCVSVARRRAGGAKMALRREILLYAVHGVLHLCGMNDARKKDFDEMHRLEDEILTRIGVGAVFAQQARPGSGKRVRRR
jgi:probable rRNA maturation factor